MSFVTSNRGAQKFIDDNHFVYVFSKKSGNEEDSIWVFEKRGQCKGRIWTIDNIVTPHNHASEATRVPVLNILSRVNERAHDTEETPQQILATNFQNVHGNIIAKLPRQDAIKRTIRRQRNEQGLPELPTDLEYLNISPQYQIINVEGVDQQFLKYDSHDTYDNLNMLNRSDSWYGNGTFCVAPNLFFQLYTIHVEQYGTVIPAIYALLPYKTKETYQKLLQELKNLIPGLFPTRILLGFKAATMGAFSEKFEGIVVSGCFLHYAKMYGEEYKTDADFALNLRLLSAIAFVPVESIVDASERLCDKNILPPEAQPVVDYFENTWIRRPHRRQHRRAPQFSHQMWNWFDGVQQGLPKTNNSIKGWHRGFETQIGADYPNIWKFIEAIQREQSLNALQIEQYISGQEGPPMRKKYRDCAMRIAHLVDNYYNIMNNIYIFIYEA
ncbi:hypothetical protein RN001_006650 [Aquatica leii]|uniref:MULE transposase domain-containing protein n=1 Tax=Aquatica leii TaxID=1421715 RepID=A0AAN7PIV0_9COLE|nr:hypothetical protein RN001_006650 [Aquatica leii]